MKNTLTAILMATSAFLFAQEKLEIKYEFEYAFDLSKAEKASTLDFYKATNENKGEYTLITSKTEATFSPIEKLNNQQNPFAGKISILPPTDSYYLNYITNEIVELKQMPIKSFIVKDILPTFQWVVQKEKTKLLGYDVKRATATQNNITYEAWFASKLNFKSGPFSFNGLPGVILKLTETDAQGHKKITKALEVKINDKAKINQPTKGEVISKEGYEAFMQEMLQKQQERLNNRVIRKID